MMPTKKVSSRRPGLTMKIKSERMMLITLPAPKCQRLRAVVFGREPEPEPEPEPVDVKPPRTLYKMREAMEIIERFLKNVTEPISTTQILESKDFAAAYGKDFTKSAITHYLRRLRAEGRVKQEIVMLKDTARNINARTAFWKATTRKDTTC